MTNKTSLMLLTEAELAAVQREAEKAYFEVRAEIERRFVEKLKTAYGDELSLVDDIWTAVDRNWLGESIITWCWYCGSVPGWQREHQVPVARGGGNGANVVPACNGCNKTKRDMTVAEYRAWLEARVGHPVVFHGEQQ